MARCAGTRRPSSGSPHSPIALSAATEVSSKRIRVAENSVRNCSRLVALAMGAVTLGRAISQAIAISAWLTPLSLKLLDDGVTHHVEVRLG